MVDVAIVGHMGSAAYIGAIAIGAGMFNMLYMLFGFLRMGASGITAQALGRGDTKAVDAHLYRGLAIALIIGFTIILTAGLTAKIMLPLMKADAATYPLAEKYFIIAVSGAPATLGTFALSGWLLGKQDSKLPMWTALVTNIVNIASSLTLVYIFNIGISGVAAGVAIAQWTGFIFGLAMAYHRYKPQIMAKMILDLKSLKKFFSINTDIFLRTLCLMSVTLWFTRSGSAQGVDILAANAVLLQLFLFFSYFMDGFAFAGEALAGKFTGQHRSDDVAKLIKRLTRIGLFLAIIFSAVYLSCGQYILKILTDDIQVIKVCKRYLGWAVVVPLAGSMAFVWDGILIGLTLTRIMLFSMFSASAIFFIIYFLLGTHLENDGLWLAFIIYLAIRASFEQILYRRFRLTHNL